MTDTLVTRLTHDYWHLVAHRSELARPGDYVRLDWPLGELVLFNDEGEIIAFDNICPHRGGRFFVEDAGAGRAVCPYHGWSYRRGMVRAARPELFDACDLQRADLASFQIAWCGGFLFVGVAPVAPLDRQLAGLAEELAAVSEDIERRADLDVRRLPIDWRVLVENALESEHVNAVHGETLAPLALNDEQETLYGDNCAYAAAVGAGRTAKALAGVRRFFDARHGADGYRSLYLFPFAMLSSTYGLTYGLQTYLPAAEGRSTHFRSRLLAVRSAPDREAITAPFLTSAAQFNRRVFDEDAAICARVSPHYDLDGPQRIFGKREARVAHFVGTLQRIRAGGQAQQRASA
jgi:phenylpropionate dioxygenase-like ring-hydroxylating dioxygenase large terminal subunit